MYIRVYIHQKNTCIIYEGDAKAYVHASICNNFNVIHFIDYDYDFIGFTDYRGGYNETFFDDYCRAFDGDYLGQRPGRQNSVGFEHKNFPKLYFFEKKKPFC